MPVEVNEAAAGSVVEVEITGKLTRADYTQFVPSLEQQMKSGKIRLLVRMHDFHGWDLGALWEDIKFDVKHFNHVERLAMVGETKWQKAMATFCRPFTTAKIRYFDQAQLDEARAWIVE